MAKRILVSGGAGFIGSFLAEELVRRGHEVVVLDANKPQIKVEWRKGNLLDGAELVPLIDDCDSLCHLAAIGDVYQAAEDPVKTVRVNVEGTLNLLLAASRAKMGKFLYASTWEVYGYPIYEPIDENHPCAPDHPYSITKLAGERLCCSANGTGRMAVVSLRLGTAYGPGMRPTSVISRFIRAGVEGRPIRIHGSGNQFRQFTHLGDIAEAFALALSYNGPRDVFNIVSDKRTTIRDLASMVRKRFDVPIEFTPSRKRDAPSAYVSSRLALEELGWEPQVDFSKAFSDLVATYGASESVRDSSS